jgi:hypothetical protein
VIHTAASHAEEPSLHGVALCGRAIRFAHAPKDCSKSLARSLWIRLAENGMKFHEVSG